MMYLSGFWWGRHLFLRHFCHQSLCQIFILPRNYLMTRHTFMKSGLELELNSIHMVIQSFLDQKGEMLSAAIQLLVVLFSWHLKVTLRNIYMQIFSNLFLLRTIWAHMAKGLNRTKFGLKKQNLQKFLDVFRGFRRIPLVRNELLNSYCNLWSVIGVYFSEFMFLSFIWEQVRLLCLIGWSQVASAVP